jgi:hypothetical protein
VKSTNGGGAYVNPSAGDPAPARLITTVATPTPGSLPSATTSIKVRAFPQIAIDTTAAGSPTLGYIYVVFHAAPGGASADKADVFFTRSIDGGVTWSTPRSISSGLAATIGRDTTTNDQWNPSITVSPVNGHIYVTWYDRREDPANINTRIYRGLSTDAGQTWNVAPFGTSSFVPIAGFAQAGMSNEYWGEYNWSQSNASGLQFTWGDSHNLCAPPAGAANPCSPTGRPDLDAYYHAIPNLSGPDLFIKPWGAVTGEGPTWQTPYIYVVDASNVRINALKGTINRLRARVRNIGNAAANGALVHFKYAPWFAGINDSLFKDVGPTVAVNFSEAGGGNGDQVVPINWDLTNTSDTNGGLWPQPISMYQHFCVEVVVELAGDINLSNNAAQSNFFNVETASKPAGNAPQNFMVAGYDERVSELPASARIIVSKLPRGFGAAVKVKGVDNPVGGFRLRPSEIRDATVAFTAPKGYKSARDVVADVTLMLDGKASGGISARLYRSPEQPKLIDIIGDTKSRFWEIKAEDRTEKVQSEPQPAQTVPPARTIPKPVQYRRTYHGGYDKVYEGVLAALRQRDTAPELANRERGLINTRSTPLKRAEISRQVVAEDRKQVEADGAYFMSIWLEPHGDGDTAVGVDSFIATDDVEAPMGRRLHSNGTLERALLTALARVLGQ